MPGQPDPSDARLATSEEYLRWLVQSQREAVELLTQIRDLLAAQGAGEPPAPPQKKTRGRKPKS